MIEPENKELFVDAKVVSQSLQLLRVLILFLHVSIRLYRIIDHIVIKLHLVKNKYRVLLF